MSTKKNAPPPRPEAPPRSVFDQREQLAERGEKLGNLVRLTELPDPTEGHPEPPKELYRQGFTVVFAQLKSVFEIRLKGFLSFRKHDCKNLIKPFTVKLRHYYHRIRAP